MMNDERIKPRSIWRSKINGCYYFVYGRTDSEIANAIIYDHNIVLQPYEGLKSSKAYWDTTMELVVPSFERDEKIFGLDAYAISNIDSTDRTRTYHTPGGGWIVNRELIMYANSYRAGLDLHQNRSLEIPEVKPNQYSAFGIDGPNKYELAIGKEFWVKAKIIKHDTDDPEFPVQIECMNAFNSWETPATANRLLDHRPVTDDD